MDSAVETFGLTKSYGAVKALDSLSVKVRKGEILVLLGPNGSGKSTLLLLLSTVLKPTAGTATVMGYDIVKQPLKVRETIGISFQEARGFWRHKPYHILAFHAAIYGLRGKERSEVVDQTLIDFDLWPSRNKKFMELSRRAGEEARSREALRTPPGGGPLRRADRHGRLGREEDDLGQDKGSSRAGIDGGGRHE